MNRHGLGALAGALVGLSLLAPATAWTQTANITLTNASATLTQTGDTTWLLEKVGALNGNTVSWVIGATEQATVPGQLIASGQVTVTNSGSGPATIGNIVVNLQTRAGNKWVTRSSDVANATDGDDATTANIHRQASSEGLSSFSENAASGSLQFMDASNNTVFSLVPQVVIVPGETRALLFQASFDNTVLNIPAGTQVRSETIVSFGNATANGNSTANVDINGNGSLDADEGRVRSVPSRLGLTVPAAVNGNGAVALTDTLDDITATGDVQFSNVIISLGATSGTVTANVTGGTNGGSITNCAHLRSADQNVGVGGFTFPIVDGVDLQSCSTVAVGGTPPNCTPGAPGCGWGTGDMQTGTQNAYGNSSTSEAGVLAANFASVLGSLVTVGGTFTMRFTSVSAIFTYLPSVGSAGPLTGSLLNPQTSSSGELGGEVLALQLNVDLSGAWGNAVDLGSLRFCNYTDVPQLNGQTVDQFLLVANHVLGGGAAAIGLPSIVLALRDVNAAFANEVPSSFAQASLVAGNCP